MGGGRIRKLQTAFASPFSCNYVLPSTYKRGERDKWSDMRSGGDGGEERGEGGSSGSGRV